jgi:hypothetical protein
LFDLQRWHYCGTGASEGISVTHFVGVICGLVNKNESKKSLILLRLQEYCIILF